MTYKISSRQDPFLHHAIKKYYFTQTSTINEQPKKEGENWNWRKRRTTQPCRQNPHLCKPRNIGNLMQAPLLSGIQCRKRVFFLIRTWSPVKIPTVAGGFQRTEIEGLQGIWLKQRSCGGTRGLAAISVLQKGAAVNEIQRGVVALSQRGIERRRVREKTWGWGPKLKSFFFFRSI